MTAGTWPGDAEGEPLRVLIAGMGSIGQRHARNLRAILGTRVEILAYRHRGRSQVVASSLTADRRSVEDAYGIESFSSLDAALDRSPNVAFICNPTSQHVPTALACANAGCDLFIEKPVSDGIDGLEELVDVVTHRRLVAAVGCQLRFHPALRLLKDALDRGVIGRPLAVRAEVGEYLPDWHPYEDYRESYAARRSLGGGVILTLIHEIDYLTWLFGVPKSVYAVGGHLSTLELDVEDVVSILSSCSCLGNALPVHLQMDYVRRPPRRSCSVLGDAGSLDLDLRRQSLTLTDTDGRTDVLFDDADFERNDLFVAELQDFLSARHGRTDPLVTLQDGVAALRVALAARQSLETRHPVSVA